MIGWHLTAWNPRVRISFRGSERLRQRGRFGIVADDLTGAGDTGLQYHRVGLRTWIITRFPATQDGPVPADVEAVAVNAGTRHLESLVARERVADAARYLRQTGCSDFYLKVDSTLRGNIGSEISGLLDELGLDLAIVAPAFPEAGRTTVGGFQLVNGTPVSLSSYSQDPLVPVLESHLPTLLAASGLKVAAMDLRTVLAGWEAIAGAIAEARAAGTRALVVDAVRTQDLEALARAVTRSPAGILPVGSAGFAGALMAAHPGRGPTLLVDRPSGRFPGTPVGRILGRTAPVLVVSGSPNPTTLEQIKHLGATARLVLVDVKQLLLTDGPAPPQGVSGPGHFAPDTGTPSEAWALHQELAMAGRQALQGLLAGRDVVVTTAISAEQVAKDRELGRELGMTRGQVGNSVAHALGALARHLNAQATLGGVVAAGGETAAAICCALPGERLEIQEEVLPAIPLSRVVGRNLRLVTKSGGFGTPETLRMIVEYLRQTEEVA